MKKNILQIFSCTFLLYFNFISCNKEPKKEEKLSLSQIEAQNGKLLDSIADGILNQIAKKDFITLLNQADPSLTKVIDSKDLHNYFKLIDSFYGSVDSIKKYGIMTTASIRTIDNIINFKSGDSLELHYELKLSNLDAKLTYITCNRFEKDPIPKSILKVVTPKIENIFNKKYEAVANDCTTKLQKELGSEKLIALLDKNLKNSDNSYTIQNSKPLIFGKGAVGFLVIIDKKINNEDKKIKVMLLQEKSGEFKINDILFSKSSEEEVFK